MPLLLYNPPRAETGGTFGRKVLHNTKVASGPNSRPQNLPRQEPVNITKTDIQQVTGMKSWIPPRNDIIHAYWPNKLIVLQENLANKWGRY